MIQLVVYSSNIRLLLYFLKRTETKQTNKTVVIWSYCYTATVTSTETMFTNVNKYRIVAIVYTVKTKK